MYMCVKCEVYVTNILGVIDINMVAMWRIVQLYPNYWYAYVYCEDVHMYEMKSFLTEIFEELLTNVDKKTTNIAVTWRIPSILSTLYTCIVYR